MERYSHPLDRLHAELEYIFNDPEFDTAHWGVAIQSLDNGQYLYLRNEHKGFIPASNMKMFTCAAALAKLTPDFRYTTYLYGGGTVDEGVLDGDLIVRGSGDPSITGRFHDGNILAVFEMLADSLKERGIYRIAGDIIGDDNFFGDEIMGAGWSWDYQSDYYAAQISALSLNDNCMDIIFTPGDSLGALARYRLEPETDYVQIVNKVTTVAPERARGIYFNRQRGTNNVEITGTLSREVEEKRDWFSVENPTLFAAHVFAETLRAHGITVDGAARDIDSLDEYRYDGSEDAVLARYQSPPLHEIVNAVLKVSQNLYAEMVMRTLGATFDERGTAGSSAQVMRDFFAEIGISTDLGIADGSGLSRLDMVTPRQVITLLRAMWRHRARDYFYDALPIAGVDGTIGSRMRGTAAAGNVRAKTGFISRARALSGYVTTKDGEHLVFSMIVNNYTVPTSMANNIQDLVCERLANFSRNQ